MPPQHSQHSRGQRHDVPPPANTGGTPQHQQQHQHQQPLFVGHDTSMIPYRDGELDAAALDVLHAGSLPYLPLEAAQRGAAAAQPLPCGLQPFLQMGGPGAGGLAEPYVVPHSQAQSMAVGDRGLPPGQLSPSAGALPWNFPCAPGSVMGVAPPKTLPGVLSQPQVYSAALPPSQAGGPPAEVPGSRFLRHPGDGVPPGREQQSPSQPSPWVQHEVGFPMPPLPPGPVKPVQGGGPGPYAEY